MPDFFRLESDVTARRLVYMSAALLIAVPFLQAGQQLWPLQLDNIRWRFAAANSLSSILLLPFLGLTIITLTARATDSRTIARVVSIISALFVIGLLGSLMLFALDALQLKSIVNTQGMSPFQTTSLRVVIVTMILTAGFAMVAIAAFKSSRDPSATPKKGSKAADEKVGLIVGRV